MKDTINKSFRKTIKLIAIFFISVTFISFVYGGIYTEIILEGLGFSFFNILLAFIGAIFISALLSIPIFIIVFFTIYLMFSIKQKKKD